MSFPLTKKYRSKRLLAGRTLRLREIVSTEKFSIVEQNSVAVEASGAEIGERHSGRFELPVALLRNWAFYMHCFSGGMEDAFAAVGRPVAGQRPVTDDEMPRHRLCAAAGLSSNSVGAAPVRFRRTSDAVPPAMFRLRRNKHEYLRMLGEVEVSPQFRRIDGNFLPPRQQAD